MKKEKILKIAAESMKLAEDDVLNKVLREAERNLPSMRGVYENKTVSKWERELPLYVDTDFTFERLRHLASFDGCLQYLVANDSLESFKNRLDELEGK